MLLLPASGRLSLSEAAQFVMERTGENKARVREAMIEAGLAGMLTATGCMHFSAHPDPAKYFAHPALGEPKPVPPQDWGLTISWPDSRIGSYDLVRLNRADIERWLAVAATNGDKKAHEDSPSPRPKKRKKETQVDAIAAWLRERYSNRPAMTVKELMPIVQQDARHIGAFKQRTFEKALKKAYS
jgi:hypothetical protein